ncbi:deoxyribodipyrimidine photo-lyase [Phycicoccus sp. SLBN-51]|uniref:cryptochrome/photolyase family protein n=1 Tax=Phycicoccus sp. SLBN-51 TaxID=2768447 RepID=UPI00114E0DB0|nr:deoxyribodipyrimidine photo-lyase [Phycicoccus sp. SLBN-51]TQJ52292.1 deoxyribodipyrimidine photo-lyase type I [Phycicoccus sp. SLBN-51]
MAVTVVWLRRDLRMRDHPALTEAAHAGETVLPLFVLDPQLIDEATPRRDHLLASLRALDDAMDGRLVVRRGRPEEVVAAVSEEVGAESVHVSAETTPYGRRRDERVRQRLERDGRSMVATGTPYAVGPGTLTKPDGTAYQVFTPFSKAWRSHGWPGPAPMPRGLRWARADSEGIPEGPEVDGAGEESARRRWKRWLDEHLGGYDGERDRPDLDSTSRMSAPLKYGELHPRTLLADIAAHEGARSQGARTYTDELCWREFYADVLWHHPESAWHDLKPALSSMTYSRARKPLEAWQRGETGFPMVDAGMRQLLTEGWMHNRVRMITASFLVKDLHIWWPEGARHFLAHLRDGDIASNNHGWQWVAGTGTDAAPYFRVFNPVTQGMKFDPDGEYVRRWVPELRHLAGKAAHEPWEHDEGYAHGYPERIVDHKVEREEALRRYEAARRG